MHVHFSVTLLGSCGCLKVLLTPGACSHISTALAVHMLDAPVPLLVLLTALWHLAGLLNCEFYCVRKALRVACQSKSYLVQKGKGQSGEKEHFKEETIAEESSTEVMSQPSACKLLS